MYEFIKINGQSWNCLTKKSILDKVKILKWDGMSSFSKTNLTIFQWLIWSNCANESLGQWYDYFFSWWHNEHGDENTIWMVDARDDEDADLVETCPMINRIGTYELQECCIL